MSNTPYTTDVAIIGAGPTGLFAAFQLGMLSMRAHIIDTLPMIGGQCSALYPEKPIYDIPGYPSILAEELIQKLHTQAAPFAPHYHLDQRVEKLTRDDSNQWRIETSKGTEIYAKAIIIAAGCGAFGPNRPPLEGIESYENKSVFYHVTQKEYFRNKRIVIAGGGDSAADWAIALSDIAAHVSVIHRRPKFRAAPESQAKLEALFASGKIELVVPYQLHALEGNGEVLSAVHIKSLEGEERSLPADALLAFFGLAMELGPIAQWGLALDKKHISVDPHTMQTNIEGIYAVGDIATYEKKLKLILCGFSEVAMASHAIYPLVHPDKALHFEYSTSKGTGTSH